MHDDLLFHIVVDKRDYIVKREILFLRFVLSNCGFGRSTIVLSKHFELV